MVVSFGQRKSVSKVVAALKGSINGVSQKDIVTATGLSERSVKAALKHLELSGAIFAASVISDLRRKVFYIGGLKNGDK